MTITVKNQKPTALDPVHQIPTSGPYDPIPPMTSVLVDPLLTPLNPSTPVSITDGGGDVDPKQVITACFSDTIDPDAEKDAKSLLGQCLLDFEQSTSLPIAELFPAQAGKANSLPAPLPHKVLYTAGGDVTPAAKKLLTSASHADLFFASLDYTFHPDTLGFWFTTSQAFADFKDWARTEIASMSLPQRTTGQLGDFDTLDLKGLTESLLLRRSDAEGNDEDSFARVIVHLLMGYVLHQRNQGLEPTMGALPFTVGELFVPNSLVLVNVESHARSTPSKINREWKTINAAIASPVKVVSNKKISRLTSLQRNATRAATAATKRQKDQTQRSAKVVFRKKPSTTVDLFADVTRVLKRMGKVNQSQNVVRRTRTSFMKPNRRDPDDVNKKGRITSVSYLPDVHLYLDTSGSISEENYQDAAMMLCALTRKLGVNLYFNSFSSVLSQEALLRTEGKSMKRIWREFSAIPKVTGGTNYRQIWDYIQARPSHQRRLSLVITDFEWPPPTTRVDHPRNLYYAPCSAMNWTRLTDAAQEFATGMTHIDPTIRTKLLGLMQ